MKNLENHYMALFVVLIMFSLYYSCFTFLLLVYYNENLIVESRFSMIIITNLDRKECVWLNLSFYFVNTVLYWIYTQRYYNVYWVNTIR